MQEPGFFLSPLFIQSPLNNIYKHGIYLLCTLFRLSLICSFSPNSEIDH